MPFITGVSPRTGNLSGGTAITVDGNGFDSDATISLDGVPCTGIAHLSSNRLTCVTPAGALGPANLVVTNEGTGLSRNLAGGFVYDGFGANVRVSDATFPISTAQQAFPKIADLGGGSLVSVWLDGRNGFPDVYVARSVDGGVTWSPNALLGTSTFAQVGARGPSLVVDSNGVLVCAWTGPFAAAMHAVSRSSTDGGVTWSPAVRIDDSAELGSTDTVRLAAGQSGEIVAAWAHTSVQIRSASSLDGGATWSTSTRIDDAPPGSSRYSPVVAFDGAGNVVSAWGDERTGRFGSEDVYFARSTDRGVTWSSNTKVNDSAATKSGIAQSPTIQVDPSGAIVCAWPDDRNSGDVDIYASRSTDDGATWSTDVRLNDDGLGSGGSQQRPDLAVRGAALLCAWSDFRSTGQGGIAFSATTDGGATWSPNTLLDDGVPSLFRQDPALAVGPGGELRAAWVDGRTEISNDTYVSSSQDGGTTWSAATLLNDDTEEQAQQRGPDVAVDTNGVICSVWSDPRTGSPEIYVSRSTDGGATWSADAILNDRRTSVQYDPDIARGPGARLVCVWTDWRNGDPDIFFSRSSDGGATWSRNVKVNDVATVVFRPTPAIAAEPGGGLVCAWADERSGDLDVYFSRSVDLGRTWSPSIRVDDATGTATQTVPVLVVEPGGALVCAWSDARGGDFDVHVSRSTDQGATWSASLNLTPDPAVQSRPTLVTSGALVVCAWSEERVEIVDGNAERFTSVQLARSTDAGATWSAASELGPGSELGNTFPSLAAEPGGALVCAWLGGRSFFDDVQLSRSTDGGLTWTVPSVLNDDGHPFVYQSSPKVATTPDGSVVATWLDSRNGSPDTYFVRGRYGP